MPLPLLRGLIRTLALAFGLCAILGPGALQAAPSSYDLQPEGTTLRFFADFGQGRIIGNIPIASADLKLDIGRIEHSSITVTLNVAEAEIGNPIAEQVLLGPSVLAAKTYPQITFTSTTIRTEGNGLQVDGFITIRGVTRPMVMHAHLRRQPGRAKGDHTLMRLHMTGTLRRSDFGATGWSDLVGDEVSLVIRARIKRED